LLFLKYYDGQEITQVPLYSTYCGEEQALQIVEESQAIQGHTQFTHIEEVFKFWVYVPVGQVP
jgi:hypothetical protein